MRAGTFVLLATCMFAVAFCEDTTTTTTSAETCASNLGTICSSTDTDCWSAYYTQASCVTTNCVTLTDLSSYASCIHTTCTSSNTTVQTYYENYAACINATILSVSAFIVALFALLF